MRNSATIAIRIQANDPRIVAPCGIDCSLCRAYVRASNPCSGCRGSEQNKSTACLNCAIRNCTARAAGGDQFCSTCVQYPCAELRHLDARYRTKYGVSVIANLARIEAVGVHRFVAEENVLWSCQQCGAHLCMHKPKCMACGHTWHTGDSLAN